MAKSGRERPLPSTPASPAQPAGPPPAQPAGPPPAQPPGTGSQPGTGKAKQSPARPARSQDAPTTDEPEHVIAGTGCLAGHERGEALTTGNLGKLPSRKKARIGFGVVLWCLIGASMLYYAGVSEQNWTRLAVQLALLWLGFAAILVRRAGHRKRCWRTRSWRHAWGGLAPGSGADPTRPAGT